ncbi:MAG: beta strand repeat-containing protein [Acidimicrobiales bacterium]
MILVVLGLTTPAPASAATGTITIDKQISVNGGATWQDVGIGVLNDPTVLAGAKVFERVIVTNSGTAALRNVSVSDASTTGGASPANFTFGGAASVATLPVGQQIVSDAATFSASSGHQFDTATVTGTVNSVTVSASDRADYTGLVGAIAIDKQISANGGATWQDVGSGNLAQDPLILAGDTVLERVIVTNTGTAALSNVSVSDSSTTGGAFPANFTFGGVTTVSTLPTGQQIISDTATFSASLGYQLDTATATGTAADASGNSASVAASDQANYTGVVGPIAIDKQISVNGGVTWQDVGIGVFNDPTVLAGAKVTERVIVTNSGTAALSNVSVSDASTTGGAVPSGFKFGGATSVNTLPAGQQIVSDWATFSASGGHQFDTATVTGTVNSVTVSASDRADYTGLVGAIAIDKQISANGGVTWQDVGNGNLAQDPTVVEGAKVTERVIVTNSGTAGLSNVSVSDSSTTGGAFPANFTFDGAASVKSLAVGQQIVSDKATFSASLGYQLDTATATGTTTDASGNSASVAASDQANYTGVVGAIASVSGHQTYGSSAPTFTYSRTPSGASVTGTLTCTKVIETTQAISSALAAGVYTIKATSCSGLGVTGSFALSYAAAPTDFRVTKGTATVTVSGHQTYGSSAPTFTYSRTPSGASVTGTLTCTKVIEATQTISSTLAAGVYTIKATSCSGLGVTGNFTLTYAATASGFVIDVTTPGAPSALVAQSSIGAVRLHWTVPRFTGGAPITGYEVFVGTAPNSESITPVATVSATSYTDTDVTPGATYYYRVETVTGFGNSAPSNEATATVTTDTAGSIIVSAPTGNGYWVTDPAGTVHPFGAAVFYGSMGGKPLNQPIVGMAPTPTGKGYWLVASDGGVFAFGNAAFDGSMGGPHLNEPMVGMAATPTGKGYWLVASDGGVFAFGNAAFDGSMGSQHLNEPMVGMAPTPTGKGYWLVASDGGVFAFGNAAFDGSMGSQHLNEPMAGMAATPTGKGYWLVASDGGVFSFGAAVFYGSMGGKPLNQPVVGMAATLTGKGYWLAASDGGVFSFGAAEFYGSGA